MKVDYTTWTLGRLTDYGRIEICPRCGRKGALRRYPETNCHGAFWRITHTGRIGEYRARHVDKCEVAGAALERLL